MSMDSDDDNNPHNNTRYQENPAMVTPHAPNKPERREIDEAFNADYEESVESSDDDDMESDHQNNVCMEVGPKPTFPDICLEGR